MEGSFWWNAHLYKDFVKCNLGKGDSIFFWHDNWTDAPLSAKFPELQFFAHNTSVSVATVTYVDNLLDLFHTPLSVQAYEQFIELQEILPDSPSSENDCWFFNDPNQKFSSIQIYSALMGNHRAHILFQKLWKCACRLNHKIFFWLALQYRVNTRAMLKRKDFFFPATFALYATRLKKNYIS